MSQEEAEQKALTGKAKKAKRSEERHKKAKKAKAQETALPAGADEQTEQDSEAAAAAAAEPDKASSKKRKRPEDDQEATKEATTTTTTTIEEGATAATKKPKKRRKAKAQPAAEAATTAAAEGVEGATAAAPKNQRFIVFIGNLPFTATTQGITEHFASIQPTSIRHLTEPGTSKSKGYAFLEFANYDRMKTCLKLFHHSDFDSGVGGERGKRKINVELTAGGGGSKSGFRQEKLKAKNVKLDEQRKRRAEAAAKQEKRKAKKDAAKGGAKEEDQVEDVPGEESQEGIHPARLAMLNKRY